MVDLTMVSRNSKHDPEIKQQLKEIKRLQKEIEKKKRDYAKKTAEEAKKAQRVIASREAKVTQERLRRREELNKKIAEKKRQEERARKLEEKKTIKEEKKEARKLKVIAAKESRHKKIAAGKNFLKTKINNLKVYGKKATYVALLAGCAFVIYKSNVVQDTIADIHNKKLIEQSIKDNEMEEETVTPVVEVEEPVEVIEEEPVEEVIEEEPIEEEHEIVNTDLYDSGYDFDENITPEFLKDINPALSNDTAWLCIPGTNINYPVVHPTNTKIDEVEGLQEKIEQYMEENNVSYVVAEYAVVNDYYLKRNLTGEKSSEGTLHVDMYSQSLINHTKDLSDITVIYGHNNKNNSQFGQLDNWKNPSYNDEHSDGIIYLSDGYAYHVTFITSRIVSGDEVSVLHLQNFESYEEKKQFFNDIIAEAKEKGIFTKDEYDVQPDDKFVCLSTCSYEFNNARYLLYGKLDRIKVRDYDYNYNQDGYYVEESSTLHR